MNAPEQLRAMRETRLSSGSGAVAAGGSFTGVRRFITRMGIFLVAVLAGRGGADAGAARGLPA